jgi:hypothetical protein
MTGRDLAVGVGSDRGENLVEGRAGSQGGGGFRIVR